MRYSDLDPDESLEENLSYNHPKTKRKRKEQEDASQATRRPVIG